MSASDQDIRDWCRACGVEEQIPDLIATARAVESAYLEFRRQARAGMKRVLGAHTLLLYERTTLFRVYEHNVIPGLFQTAAYCTARSPGRRKLTCTRGCLSISRRPPSTERCCRWCAPTCGLTAHGRVGRILPGGVPGHRATYGRYRARCNKPPSPFSLADTTCVVLTTSRRYAAIPCPCGQGVTLAPRVVSYVTTPTVYPV